MYFVLAYYHFKPIQDVDAHIKEHKAFLMSKDAKGRIYINEKGINGQISIHEDDALDYMRWMKGFDFFQKVEFKIHESKEHAFAKLTVKYRKELVAIEANFDMNDTAKHLSPEKWREMLETKDENTILIDVRNDYEWQVGHFDGAILPKLKTFRDFKKYIEDLKKSYNTEKTKVMMYCTGGIRCEIYSCLMKEKGFESVYQLDGGVINYGLKEGNKHWKGKLFVFDDRLVVPISKDKAEVISHCRFCEKPSDVYYNCANMDCNDLFISCLDCISNAKGCCSEDCQQAPRVRPFEVSDDPKPFRKLPFEEKCQLNEKANQL